MGRGERSIGKAYAGHSSGRVPGDDSMDSSEYGGRGGESYMGLARGAISREGAGIWGRHGRGGSGYAGRV